MNAVMHRDYQSNMPTRLYQYDSYIEIMNPGGLYGQARPENFPHVNDYRNGVVAEMMKTLNYVNMFNHGVSDVQDLLKENHSPAAEFNVGYVTVFSVIVREPYGSNFSKLIQTDGKAISSDYQNVLDELYQAFPKFGKVQMQVIYTILDACKEPSTIKEIMSACGVSSRTTFDRVFFGPARDKGLVLPIYPKNLRHPQQKYLVTELGLEILQLLRKDTND